MRGDWVTWSGGRKSEALFFMCLGDLGKPQQGLSLKKKKHEQRTLNG